MRTSFLAAVALLAAGCATPGADIAPASVADLVIPTYTPAADLIAAIDAAAGETAITVHASAEVDPTGRGLLAPARAFQVLLRPSAMLAGAPFAEIDGSPVAFPDVRAYEGEVAGHPEFPVRLTATNDWARGTIRMNDTMHLVRVGLDGNLPFYAPAGVEARAGSSAIIPALPMSYDRDGDEGEDCLLLVPPHTKPVLEPAPGPSAQSLLRARIVLDADAQFVEALGPHAFPMMVAFLNEVDAVYAHEMGIRFQLVGLHQNLDPEYYPDPEDDAPLAKAAEYWNARPDVERDIVHVFTGQRSSYAQANCIGGAGHPEIAYTFTPLNWARDHVVFHEMAFAHELGHIFSAHHHYGNHAEASWGSATLRPVGAANVTTMPQAGLATIMIQGYTPGAKPVFSSLSKSVIRGWMESEIEQR